MRAAEGINTFERYANVSRQAGVLAIIAFSAATAQGQQIAKLTAEDAAEGDQFGQSVSIYGDTSVVGAFQGGFTSSSGPGSAYIYREVGGVWQQITKLTSDDAETGDGFGQSVSIDGVTAVVGAFHDDSACPAFNFCDSGSAYIFREIDGNWQQIAMLTADDGAFLDEFGYSVSLSGDTAIVGARYDDDAGEDSGSAYIFREIGGVWQQIAKLTADDGAPGDIFGLSVSIDGDTAVIGAFFDDDAGVNSGSAYIFREIGGNWQQIAKLTAADASAGDGFGTTVSIDGDTAIVGAPSDSDAGTRSGSAYVFREVGGSWQEIAKLTAADAEALNDFGANVSIDGDAILVGAFGDNDAGSLSGSAYVFREVGGVWQQTDKIISDDLSERDQFGYSVSLHGNTVVVGARFDDDACPAGTINCNSGSAYVFDTSSACLPDTNNDGMLSPADFSAWVAAFNAMAPVCDQNDDGSCTPADFSAWVANYNAGC